MAGDAEGLRRRLVSWLAMAAAVVAAAVLVIEGPPGSGYGWGSVLISCVLVAVPLVAIGLMVRTGDRHYAWPTVVLAGLIGFFVLVALLDNWSGQSSIDHVLDVISAVVTLAALLGAIAVEVPLLRTTSGPRPAARGGRLAR